MTTFQVREDQALADALTQVIPRVAPDHAATSAVVELRNAATPGNGFHLAHVPYGVRPWIARELRALAAHLRPPSDEADPLAAELDGLADGLDASAAARALNS